MLIIDNKKDIYDYLQGINGIDNKVVYDRRGSIILGREQVDITSYLVSKDKETGDSPKTIVPRYVTNKYKLIAQLTNSNRKDKFSVGKIYHYILEVGYFHYFIEVERYIDENDNVVIDVELVDSHKVLKDERISSAPMSLTLTYSIKLYNTMKFKPFDSKSTIVNPILADSPISGLISPQVIWENLYEYISSLNDKDVIDSRTNDEHIESNGFDKKTSFRNIK